MPNIGTETHVGHVLLNSTSHLFSLAREENPIPTSIELSIINVPITLDSHIGSCGHGLYKLLCYAKSFAPPKWFHSSRFYWLYFFGQIPLLCIHVWLKRMVPGSINLCSAIDRTSIAALGSRHSTNTIHQLKLPKQHLRKAKSRSPTTDQRAAQEKTLSWREKGWTIKNKRERECVMVLNVNCPSISDG